MSNFDSDLKSAQGVRATALLRFIPHCISFKKRVELFRDKIAQYKATHGSGSDGGDHAHQPRHGLIRIRRGYILEDGYHQLSKISGESLRNVIRVKFTNAQGLDEAGIDQDGVFKEFLEETIKKAFDPNVGLFQSTATRHMYPSLASRTQENSLSLFEFVGKMLGKSVFEGFLVEAPFAHFFLAKILGRYNGFDELSSLDPDLYRNLTLIKRYSEEEVEDLGLTFSVDEEVFGQVRTVDLRPGGRVCPVTSANRILYVHLMADYRMNQQLKLQSDAFIRGFKMVIQDSWLLLFSPSELQKLISGDSVDFDVKDLRNHTQYLRGYHNSHRVIEWLWEAVEEFDPKERCLFLKFVTSCSKPPMLGFAHLQPPFSITCVEDQEPENVILNDSLTGTIKGFFSSGRDTERLPTSSTCFNLLKLPNYKKKKTLVEKLKYAIHSGAGFELS